MSDNGTMTARILRAGTQAERPVLYEGDTVELDKQEIIDILKTLEGLKRKLQPKLK